MCFLEDLIGKMSLTNVRFMLPTAGAPIVEFIATLPTASLHLQWLLWSRKIEKSYDSCQSEAALQLIAIEQFQGPRHQFKPTC